MLRELGAHAVVVHRRGEDFSAQVRALTDGRGVDVAIDNVGSPLFNPTRKSIAVRGRWILIGQLNGDFVPFNPAQLFLKNISMLSATSTTRNQLVHCLHLVAAGTVRPVIRAGCRWNRRAGAPVGRGGAVPVASCCNRDTGTRRVNINAALVGVGAPSSAASCRTVSPPWRRRVQGGAGRWRARTRRHRRAGHPPRLAAGPRLRPRRRRRSD